MATFDSLRCVGGGGDCCHGDDLWLGPHPLRVQGDEGSRLRLPVEVTEGHLCRHHVEQRNLCRRENNKKMLSSQKVFHLNFCNCSVLPNLMGNPEGICRLMKSFTFAKWGVFRDCGGGGGGGGLMYNIKHNNNITYIVKEG